MSSRASWRWWQSAEDQPSGRRRQATVKSRDRLFMEYATPTPAPADRFIDACRVVASVLRHPWERGWRAGGNQKQCKAGGPATRRSTTDTIDTLYYALLMTQSQSDRLRMAKGAVSETFHSWEGEGGATRLRGCYLLMEEIKKTADNDTIGNIPSRGWR